MSPDNDIIIAKVESVERCLNRIREQQNDGRYNLTDFNVQDVIVLNLLRAIQNCLDIAAHVVSISELGVADTLKANYDLLYRGKIISKSLKDKLKNMVGFRNLAVHEYSQIDVEVIQAILDKHLQDFEEFCQIALKLTNKKP